MSKNSKKLNLILYIYIFCIIKYKQELMSTKFVKTIFITETYDISLLIKIDLKYFNVVFNGLFGQD